MNDKLQLSFVKVINIMKKHTCFRSEAKRYPVCVVYEPQIEGKNLARARARARIRKWRAKQQAKEVTKSH